MDRLTLAEFNTAEPERLRPLLTEFLAVPRWADHLLAGRPYSDLTALDEGAALTLNTDEIHAAMAAHPRIGDKPGDGRARSEQSGVDDEDARRFRAANVDYERRFGHVFLICASGRGGGELLTELHRRMDNDPETELRVAGEELVKIGRLRLEKAVTPVSLVTTHVLDTARGRPAAGIPVRLDSRGDDWATIAAAATDDDGRVRDLGPGDLPAGVYRLVFDTESYLGSDCFLPEVTVTFRISDPTAHHHVPVLLSPFSYSTYRGS